MVDMMPTADALAAPSRPRNNGKPRMVNQQNYRDEAGNVLFQVVRFKPKDFRQRRPDGKGGWTGSVKEARVVTHRLRELLAEPALPRLLVDDAAEEKLGMILAKQGGRSASMSPERGAFDLMAGSYSKGGIPQFGVYLIGHSGDHLITDRVSRTSVRVQRPALTPAGLGHSTLVAQKQYGTGPAAALNGQRKGRARAAQKAAHRAHKMRRSRDAPGIAANRSRRTPRKTTTWFAPIVTSRRETPREKWRKCMGIEPTGPAVNAGPDGFEDRGRHQAYSHFRRRRLAGAKVPIPTP
jgi:hypothetical protein